MKKFFTITIAIMATIIVVLIAIIIIHMPLYSIHTYGGHSVTTPENAIIIAKASLLRAYGEDEISQIEFRAFIDGSYNADYWHVSEANTLCNPPHVLVRISDGKVILRWN